MTDQPNTRGLRFYPASHRYKLDGEWVPSVTGILGAAIPKPGLTRWAANTVADYVDQNPDRVALLRAGLGRDRKGEPVTLYDELRRMPWQVRDDAGERGSLVHDCAEKIVRGEQVEVPEHLTGYVRSALDFIEDWKIDPVLIEAVVGSRTHGYAGKLDLIAEYPACNSGGRAIFDYKTSRSGIKFDTTWQNAAYVFADFHGEDGNEWPMADLEVTESWAVHLMPDAYQVYPLPHGPAIHAEFVQALNWSKILDRAEGDYRKPGTGYVGLPVTTPQDAAPAANEDW